jgi:hypothetical protein
VADDWRIRIEIGEGNAGGALARLAADLDEDARTLAEELTGSHLAVSRDGDEIFVYASSRADADRAHAIVEAQLRTIGSTAHAGGVEHWLEAEERWDDEPAGETWEQEEVDHGHAPWEVRVECSSRGAAKELADTLEREGYLPVRRFRYLIVGTASKDDADALAARVHGEVEAGGEVVWETSPRSPFAVFGGLGL